MSIIFGGLAVWCIFMLVDEIRERDWIGFAIGLFTTIGAILCALTS
jgi:hypothetical protein